MTFLQNIYSLSQQIFRYLYYYSFVTYYRCLYILGLYTPPKITTFLDENNAYIEPLKTKFLTHYNENKETQKINQQIDRLFYDKKAFSEYMQESNTSIETIWKTRILFETTPRGNLIMFYDAYKLGFSFYCDQKIISYDILNAAAMKYVSIYQCRDFFIDEYITPQKSPLIDIHFAEDAKSTNKTTFNKQRPNTTIKSIEAKEQKEKSKDKEPDKMKNKFLYLGKISNFKFLQSFPKPRKVLAKFTSPLMASLGAPNQKFSYKEFVEARNKASQLATGADPN